MTAFTRPSEAHIKNLNEFEMHLFEAKNVTPGKHHRTRSVDHHHHGNLWIRRAKNFQLMLHYRLCVRVKLYIMRVGGG